MSTPARKSPKKTAKRKSRANANAFTRDEILVADALMDGKRFRTPAPILAHIKTKYRAAS